MPALNQHGAGDLRDHIGRQGVPAVGPVQPDETDVLGPFLDQDVGHGGHRTVPRSVIDAGRDSVRADAIVDLAHPGPFPAVAERPSRR
jgi:hypothetical protein